MMRRDVFQAIADPVRREIIRLVAAEPLQMNRVADHFTVSRPAISKHVKILAECGLISISHQGRERICKPNLRRLKEVSDWTAQYHQFWNSKLDHLDQFLQARKKKG